MDPVIDATLLPGRRAWTATQPRTEAAGGEPHRLVVHWHPTGYIAVFVATPALRTWWLSPAGYIVLQRYEAENMGIALPDGLTSTDIALPDFETVCRAVTARLSTHHRVAPWEDIPEKVPSGPSDHVRVGSEPRLILTGGENRV